MDLKIFKYWLNICNHMTANVLTKKFLNERKNFKLKKDEEGKKGTEVRSGNTENVAERDAE